MLRSIPRWIASLLILVLVNPVFAQTPDSTLRVLIVNAHPDDESGISGTVYKMTHDLHARVDLAVLTNGEGGYKYSTLAEAYYGLELTDEKVGREYLPLIRKQELMNAGRIIGIRNFYFLDQRDNHYTLDPHEVLDSIWDTTLIQRRLHSILVTGRYDYVITLMPTDSTHGHHKAASVMALRAITRLGTLHKPIVLAYFTSRKGDTAQMRFRMLKDYPITELDRSVPVFRFDRTTKFGYHNVIDYRTIVSWEIAEHKSQGTLRPYSVEDYEDFYWYKINDPEGVAPTRRLFEALALIRYPQKKY